MEGRKLEALNALLSTNGKTLAEALESTTIEELVNSVSGGGSSEDYQIEIDINIPLEGEPQLTVVKQPDQRTLLRKAKLNYKYAEEIGISDFSFVFDVFELEYWDTTGPTPVIPMWVGDYEIIYFNNYNFNAPNMDTGYIQIKTGSSVTIPAESAKPFSCALSMVIGNTTYYPANILESWRVSSKHIKSRYSSLNYVMSDDLYSALALNLSDEDNTLSEGTEVYRLVNRG